LHKNFLHTFTDKEFQKEPYWSSGKLRKLTTTTGEEIETIKIVAALKTNRFPIL
jgi:hypothetical protein